MRAAAPGEMTLGPAVARRVDGRGSSLGGLSNSKVANELFASASSAKVHHVPVYSKPGVTAAVAAALVSLLLPVNSRLLPGAGIYGQARYGVRGMTIWLDPERCQMRSQRGTGAYFGVAELIFGIA